MKKSQKKADAGNTAETVDQEGNVKRADNTDNAKAETFEERAHGFQQNYPHVTPDTQTFMKIFIETAWLHVTGKSKVSVKGISH